MDIAFHDGGTCGGLDMGAKLDVKVNGKWKRSRIEFGQGWYLVGVPQSNVEGWKFGYSYYIETCAISERKPFAYGA
jgi:hypothetical protein